LVANLAQEQYSLTNTKEKAVGGGKKQLKKSAAYILPAQRANLTFKLRP